MGPQKKVSFPMSVKNFEGFQTKICEHILKISKDPLNGFGGVEGLQRLRVPWLQDIRVFMMGGTNRVQNEKSLSTSENRNIKR